MPTNDPPVCCGCGNRFWDAVFMSVLVLVAIGTIVLCGFLVLQPEPDFAYCLNTCCPVYCANSTDVPTCVLACGDDYCYGGSWARYNLVCKDVLQPPPDADDLEKPI